MILLLTQCIIFVLKFYHNTGENTTLKVLDNNYTRPTDNLTLLNNNNTKVNNLTINKVISSNTTQNKDTKKNGTDNNSTTTPSIIIKLRNSTKINNEWIYTYNGRRWQWRITPPHMAQPRPHGVNYKNYGQLSKLQQLILAMNSKDKKRVDLYYEPYWEAGDWVYMRTGTEQTSTPANEIEIYRDCDLPCSAYEGKWYGAICAQRFDSQTWEYFFKEFPTICEMESANCEDHFKRPSWFPIRQGRCVENDEFNPRDKWTLLSRADYYQEHYTHTTIPTKFTTRPKEHYDFVSVKPVGK